MECWQTLKLNLYFQATEKGLSKNTDLVLTLFFVLLTFCSLLVNKTNLTLKNELNNTKSY